MNKQYTPDSIAAPSSPYSHAVEVPAGARTLHISGQIGIKPDGNAAMARPDLLFELEAVAAKS